MRLNINLASQKYEDVRTFVSRAGAATAGMAIFTVVLAVLAWFNYSSSTNSNARVRQLEQKIDMLQEQRARASAVENLPENRDLTQQKNYWNRQIARKAFSWTQLFNDLQKIMPSRVFVISVAPEFTKDNQLKLRLTIGGEKNDDLNALVKRMEGSHKFQRTSLISQSTQTSSTPGASSLHKFDIETFYTPGRNGSTRSASREGL
ncbi:MAG TPA: PilN domain-containing protein [Candidatus Angelobacter sp.]|nr:PilN domain-containing protein [Candidatus Angelobacter sp.]